jgi:hypothetical protein
LLAGSAASANRRGAARREVFVRRREADAPPSRPRGRRRAHDFTPPIFPISPSAFAEAASRSTAGAQPPAWRGRRRPTPWSGVEEGAPLRLERSRGPYFDDRVKSRAHDAKARKKPRTLAVTLASLPTPPDGSRRAAASACAAGGGASAAARA